MTLADIIPPKLRDRFSSIAHNRQISVEAVVEEALGEYAQSHDDPNRRPVGYKDAKPIILPPISVVMGKVPLSNEALKQAIEEMEFEDDLRGLGMKHDPVA